MKTKKVHALWSHVHWLGVLAVEGSYTRCAQRLGVSKAAVSHRIVELEQAAGVSLVRRSTRSLQLTEAGRNLVDSTKDSFAQIERSFSGVKELAETPSGSLRVTAPAALGRQHIVPRMASFLSQHPHVSIELELSDRLASISQEGFDLAIRHVAEVSDTHVAWPLCKTEAVLVASKAYLRQHEELHSPGQLSKHNCLHYMRSAAAVWSFVGAREGADRMSVPIHGSFTANNSETLRELAIAGKGIALLPDFSAQDALRQRKLVRVLAHWRSVGAFGGQIFAVRPYSHHVPRSVQAFIAHLRLAMAGGFPLV